MSINDMLIQKADQILIVRSHLAPENCPCDQRGYELQGKKSSRDGDSSEIVELSEYNNAYGKRYHHNLT